MFCTNCGAPIPDGSRFCTACGAAVTAAQPIQQPPAPQNPQPDYRQASAYQQPVSQPTDRYQGFPMKWYKFLVYFSLWLSALINAVTASQVINGSHYGAYAQDVYKLWPKLQTVDRAYGAVLAVLVVLTIVTAIRLLQLKKGAPTLLLVVYAAALVSSILYLVLAAASTGGAVSISDLRDSSSGASMVTSLAMIVVNAVYFKKRESLFVN